MSDDNNTQPTPTHESIPTCERCDKELELQDGYRPGANLVLWFGSWHEEQDDQGNTYQNWDEVDGPEWILCLDCAGVVRTAIQAAMKKES